MLFSSKSFLNLKKTFPKVPFFIWNHQIDLEWRILYVGDHKSMEGDQILDSILVGPISRGTHKFCFQVCLSRFLHSLGECSRLYKDSRYINTGFDGDSYLLLLQVPRIRARRLLSKHQLQHSLEAIFPNRTYHLCRQAANNLLSYFLVYCLFLNKCNFPHCIITT